jgi:maleamate amidohydrolase
MTPALIVIDMQNAFLHPDGENFYPAAAEIIAPARALIDAAAASGTVIVHVADRHRDGFADFE